MLSADGLAWLTTPELTISFAPDGTDVAGQSSAMFGELQAPQMDGWQDAIVRAFETWTEHTPTKVRVITDSGEPLGTSGPVVGSDRFGDVRVAATSLSSDIIAMSVPLNEIASGTWSGDILLNTNYDFANVDELFAVAVHEAGHVLGLGHSSNPNSPMYYHGVSDALTPLAEDIAQLRHVFGVTLEDDFHEPSIKLVGADGEGEGEDGERNERQDEEHQDKDDREVTKEKKEKEDREEEKEEKEEEEKPENKMYDNGDDEEEQQEHDRSRSSSASDGEHVETVMVYADNLQPFHYATSGHIRSGHDVGSFHLVPSGLEDENLKNLFVTIRSVEPGNLIPQVVVRSRGGEVLETEILTNANGTLVLQVKDVSPDEGYLVQVMAAQVAEPFQTGAFELEAQFTQEQAVLNELFVDTLHDAKPTADGTLHVEKSTLVELVLVVDQVDNNVPIAMWTVVYDSAGNVVQRIAAPAGDTRSSGMLLLSPGDYHVAFQAASPDGSVLPEVHFRLSSKTMSLPIGPAIIDPTQDPVLSPADEALGMKYWNPQDLWVTDPVIFPTPHVKPAPKPKVVVDPPWTKADWWYWDPPALTDLLVGFTW